MAFLRFSRDRRGYEHFYLVEPTHRRGKSTTRVLYCFRTPPNVRVGREPFAENIRRELESQHPDVAFDWRKILDTPVPSADAEMWRDRRRAERAARAARQSAAPQEDVGEDAETEGPLAGDEEPVDEPVHVIDKAAAALSEMSLSTTGDTEDTGDKTGLNLSVPSVLRGGESDRGPRKRRRRRGRRGRPPADV